MSALSDGIAKLTDSVQQLMNEVISQKDRFTGKAEEVAALVLEAVGYRNSAKEYADRSKESSDKGALHMQDAETSKTESAKSVTLSKAEVVKASDHAKDANAAKQSTEALIDQGVQIVRDSKHNSDTSKGYSVTAGEKVELCSNEADRAHDAVAGLAADIIDLKTLITKNNGMA